MAINTSIFKDYDVRGTYPDQINGETAKAIAHAIVRKFAPKSVCICRDMRVSGPELRDAFVNELSNLGVAVTDAGLTGTEISYFIAGTENYDLVIMLSASHNPSEYNGIKLVKKGPIAVTSDSGLYEIRDLTGMPLLPYAEKKGTVNERSFLDAWKTKVLSLVNASVFKPLTVVADAGNGMGGVLFDTVTSGLPFVVTKLFFDPDGTFPNHTPNPLVESNNASLVSKVKEIGADVGITFDGDADRMYLIDDKGRFVSGTITTTILARYFLNNHPGELVLYNAICGRVVPETVAKLGGKSKRVRVGHSYIKTYMRETNAIFAGEHSGHYYYRDFFSAESGALSALIVLALLSTENKKLSQMVDELNIYPSSGEINFVVNDRDAAQSAIKSAFSDAMSIDDLDGISVWYKDYWFNVRASKTEPLLRLNVEADTETLLKEKTDMLIAKIENIGGKRK